MIKQINSENQNRGWVALGLSRPAVVISGVSCLRLFGSSCSGQLAADRCGPDHLRPSTGDLDGSYGDRLDDVRAGHRTLEGTATESPESANVNCSLRHLYCPDAGAAPTIGIMCGPRCR